jgi:hypothetical protein
MKNISTGTGLCVLGLCLASYPIIDRVMPRAEASTTHVAAVVAAATAQVPPEPTIVWYGVAQTPQFSMNGYYNALTYTIFARAWSDGRVEIKKVCTGERCDTSIYSGYGWVLISDPAQGLTYRSDINFDSKVDGADLSQVLNDWGNAPRQDIPPSTCPLNLINP